jgi:hypothetical protein
MTIRKRYTNPEELRTARKAEGARPYTSNARAGRSHEKSKKRASAEILSSPLKRPFSPKLLIRLEI